MLRLLAFMICMLPFSASATSVMTFSDLSRGGSSGPYVEDGITAQAGGFSFLGYWNTPGSAHMDSNWAYAPSITFSMDALFDAASFQYDFDNGFGSYIRGQAFAPILYNNVSVSGLRDGTEVASNIFHSGMGLTQFNFDDTFSNLDELVISLLLPAASDFTRETYCDDQCTHGYIDNVTLSAVPLPAALPLFGAALIGLGLFRKYKIKAS